MNDIENTDDDMLLKIETWESAIERNYNEIKELFKTSVKNLLREVKSKALKSLGVFPLEHQQIKALLDLKADK